VQQAVQLLEKTFIQRKDIFASQLEDGRYVCIKEPLTQRHIELHLLGHITLGTYMLTPESTSRLIVLDADQENGLLILKTLSSELEKKGIPTYLETSRRGAHLWFLLSQANNGEKVRNFGLGIIHYHQIEGVELFPKQNTLQGGPGSLVRLPFGIHKKSGRRYPFIHSDGSMLAPTVREQIQILSNHQSVPESALNEYAAYGSELLQSRSYKNAEILSDNNEIEKIKNAMPLIDFLSGFMELRPIASGAIGYCPFHEDQNPSFGVNREGNYWHCFAGCGGGSVIEFWMKYNNCDFNTAVTELKEMFEIR
jgi:hypothetical protein